MIYSKYEDESLLLIFFHIVYFCRLGNDIINSVLITGDDMKQSKYNLFFDIDDKKIAFNSMSCALAEVDEKFFNVYDNLQTVDVMTGNNEDGNEKVLNDKVLNDEEKKLIDEMKKGKFIIDDDFDEIKNLEFMFNNAKYNEKSLSVTIAPTLQCNFKCVYCYENPNQGKMDVKIQDAIIEKIKKSAERKKNIETCWYGGEPLLALDVITYMSEKIVNICKENNVSHYAGMVTNGYLLNDEIIEKLVKCNVSFIQVTLDGPRDVHDRRRVLRGNGGTFDKIIENLVKLKKYKIITSIRINIDRTNMNSVEELMKILVDNGLQSLPISLGHVMDFTDACKSISEDCLAGSEFSEICIDLSRKFVENGFEIIGRKMYPTVIGKFCGANYISNFVLDPSGNVYKCWNEIGNKSKSIGNLADSSVPDDRMLANNIKYMTWSPFDYEECIGCKYVPICMGGCSYLGMKSNKPFCTDWKYQIEKYLRFTYAKKNETAGEKIPVYEKNCL
jgi:uncharacterized protein